MKIIYVGDLQNGATSAMRMRHLQNIGHQVWGIDTIGAARTDSTFSRGVSKIAWRLGWPLDLSNINAQLVALVKEVLPDIVWVDKGILVRRETLLRIRQSTPNVRLVHYNPDDPFGAYGKAGWRRFLRAMSVYDVHFVPRYQNIQEYKAAGCRHVIHNIPTRGFDPEVHRPHPFEAEFAGQFAADVGFLGSFEQDRAEQLLYLAQRGVTVRLASTWPAHHRHENLCRAPFPVVGVEYAKALCGFKIGLCFLRKANRDQHTSRSIEIPACGTFLLAERTDEHQQLFEEGKEAEFFASADEMNDKVRFYLAHDEIRKKLASAGLVRCIRSRYSYSDRLKLMIQQIKDILEF